MPPELLYYPYNPVPPNNVLLMANVMSFHHTATLLRGGGVYFVIYRYFGKYLNAPKVLPLI